MSSAVEFVEGGVQDACDDACSVCLEPFSEQDPASVTECNHEYHLQCILEWSQRSSGCPMCWQPLHLQDASCQELLVSMEQERSLRQNRIQASLLSVHRSGNYDFHQLPESFKERLMQHFAGAVGQSHASARGGHRPSVAGQRASQFLIFPTYSTAASSGVTGQDESISPRGEKDGAGASHGQRWNASAGTIGVDKHADEHMQTHSARERSSSEFPSSSHHGSSTSDLQSFSDTIKSRLAAVSSRYKESFSKTTRIFRERLRTRNIAAPEAKVGAPEGNFGSIEGDASGQREEIDEPHSDVTAAQDKITEFATLQAEIAEDALTDVNLVHNSTDQKYEDSINPSDAGAIETSSQPIADEAPISSEDITVRTGNEGADPLDENK